MGPWLMQRLTPGHTTIPHYTILTQTGLGSADLASPPLAMGVTARRNVVLNLTMVMVIPLSMVICLMHLSMDLVLLDTQEEQPLMLLDQAQELASVVLMLSPMVSMDLFITVCLLTEELTRSMLVVDTL